MVEKIENLAQFNEITSRATPVIIDFTAAWCGPCRMIGPIFEGFANKVTGVDFYKVDIDDAADIASKLSIRSVPTFMVFQNGTKVGELLGANPGNLEKLITQSGGQLVQK